jgi:hypothetical protein
VQNHISSLGWLLSFTKAVIFYQNQICGHLHYESPCYCHLVRPAQYFPIQNSLKAEHTIPCSSLMVLDGVLGVRTRRLSLGLFTCMLIAVTLMLSNAAKFQFIDSKELGFGEVSVKPNNTDGHGHDFQVVNMDPSQRDSPSQAAPGNSTRGNSSLPHISGLRLVVDTIDPSLLKRPSKAVALDDPRAAYYPPGISTRGNSSLPHISGLRIAFVGDSLTRYMYLSLAAYLRRGRWVDETDVPNILEGKQFDAWNPFYNYTNNYFQPYEQCDCFRLEESDSAIENRYFADPVRDNVLYFFQK